MWVSDPHKSVVLQVIQGVYLLHVRNLDGVRFS